MNGSVAVSGLSEISAGRFLALDIEGTGTTPHLPVEISILTLEAGRVVDKACWLVNPGIPISPYATRIHGLTDDDVRDAPSLSEIAPMVRSAISGEVLLGHAVTQDIDILRNIIPDIDFLPSRTLDTLRLAKSLLPDLPGHRLELVMDALGLEWSTSDNSGMRAGKHTGPGDAEAAARVFLSLVERIPAKQMAHFGRMATVTMSPAKERRLREALEANASTGLIAPDPTGCAHS